MDLSLASVSAVSLGDWETFLQPAYEYCTTKGGLASYTLLDPVFELDDMIDYKIASGPYDIAFTDWQVSPPVCTIEFEYMTRETLAGV